MPLDTSGRGLLTQNLIDWADLILVMEPQHADQIYLHFKCAPDKLRVLGVRNIYPKNDLELVRELQNKVIPILELEDALRDTEEFIASHRFRDRTSDPS